MKPARKVIRGTRPGATHVTGPGGLDAKAFARWYRDRSIAQWNLLDLDALSRIARIIEKAQKRRRFIWVCGNGGSASTAAHIGCDFGKTAAQSSSRPLRTVSLADNSAFLTAVGNDLSFDQIFSRQLENVLSAGDVILLISGSGNSSNLLKAAELGRARGAKVLGLLGFDGGLLKSLCDDYILIGSDQYGIIEDLHMSIAHILTFYLKQKKS